MRATWSFVFTLIVSAGTSTAQTFDDSASINLYFGPPSFDCANFGGDVPGCGGTSPSSGQFQPLWVTLDRAGGFPDGVGGVEFGVEHDVNVLSWTTCPALDVTTSDWPASGSGIAVGFPGACVEPAGVRLVLGYFLIDSSSGTLSITGDPRLEGVNLVCDGAGSAVYVNCSDLNMGICLCDQHLASADLATGSTRICATDCSTPVATPEAGDVAPGTLPVGLSVTGVSNPTRLPAAFTIRSDVDDAVDVRIMDVGGRLVRTLGESVSIEGGDRELKWDLRDDAGKRVAMGRYFILVTGASGTASEVVTVIR